MINRYYLYKKILENPHLISPLQDDKDVNSLFSVEESQEELYNQRVDEINGFCFLTVKNIETLTGKEAADLMQQKDCIMESLIGRWNSVNMSLNLPSTFKEALEDQFHVTQKHIYNYEKAEKKLTGKRIVTVLLDGNKTPLSVNGVQKRFGVEITDNKVGIEDCQKAVKRLAEFDCHPSKLQFMLSVYTETEGNECGDFPEECLLNCDVFYFVNENRMIIYKDDMPIFENNNGVICNDPVTLADCYC